MIWDAFYSNLRLPELTLTDCYKLRVKGGLKKCQLKK